MVVQQRAAQGWLLTWFRAFATLGLGLAACAEGIERQPDVVARSLGAEVYIVFCEHLAGTEFPNDVRGLTARTVCHDDQPGPPSGLRLEGLRKNRARLVSAFDAILEDGSVRGELEAFVGELLPLLDAPIESMPNATRAIGMLLDVVAQDGEALLALQRTGGRQGYRPLPQALGTLAALFRYPGLQGLLLHFTEATEAGGVAHAAWQQLGRALGMELATYESLQPGAQGALDVLRALMLSTDARFATDTPSWMVRRDVRGYVQPNPQAHTGFVDMDGDGLVEVDERGAFVRQTGEPLAVPPPFSVLSEVESRAPVARDAHGRALDPQGAPVYDYFDADQTLLSGMGSELKAWSVPDGQGQSALLGFLSGLQEIIGDRADLSAPYGKGALAYDGPATANAPLLGGMDFVASLIEAPEFDDTLALLDRMLAEHEPVVARLTKALLDSKARADLDTQAHIVHPSNFWDEVLALLKRLAQRRLVPSQAQPDVDETALESLLRAMADPESRPMGGQIAMMGRFNTVCQDGHAKPPHVCIDLNQADINGRVQGAYTTPVDRSRPDLPAKLADGQPGNTSQLQNFLLLVGELADRPLCNKKTTGAALFAAMSSDQCAPYKLKGFIAASSGLIGGLLGDIDECGFIQVPDMGRAFGGAMMNGTAHEAQHGLDLLSYINHDTVNTLLSVGKPIGITLGSMRGLFDDIFRACSGVPEFDTRPTGPALARVLFAPTGTRTQVFGDQMFPPATLRPYLAGSPLRSFDLDHPPADLKLANVFQGSLPAWEVAWQFGDSRPSALLNSMVPMLLALNKHDFVATKDDAKRAAGAPYFDSERYLFNPLINAFALQYPSRASGYQNVDPLLPRFSHLGNLTSYEGILVDMLAEPDLNPNDYLSQTQADFWNSQTNIGLFGAVSDLLATLDAMPFEGERDGLDVLADLAARMLNPHQHCAPDSTTYVTLETRPGARDGKGACHCDRTGDGKLDPGAPAGCAGLTLRKPLTLRGSKGQDYVTWKRGETFDGVTDPNPADGLKAPAYQPLAPVDLLLQSLNDMDAKFDESGPVKAAWRGARSRMIDVLFATEGVAFTNPHTVAMLRTGLSWGRAHVKAYRDGDGGQAAVRAFSATLPGRLADFLQSPVVASTLKLFADVQRSPELTREIGAFLAHTFDSSRPPATDSFRPMLLALADGTQLMRDGRNLSPILRAISRAFVQNGPEVVAGAEPIQNGPTALDKLTDFLHRVALQDDAGTWAELLERTVALDAKHENGKVAPLETLLDVLAEVNRREPTAGGPLDADDLRLLFGHVSDFLSSKTDGMERLYQIIQNRFVHPRSDTAPQP